MFNDQSFNDTLTNDIVSFEHLGPGCYRAGAVVERLNFTAKQHFGNSEKWLFYKKWLLL